MHAGLDVLLSRSQPLFLFRAELWASFSFFLFIGRTKVVSGHRVLWVPRDVGYLKGCKYEKCWSPCFLGSVAIQDAILEAPSRPRSWGRAQCVGSALPLSSATEKRSRFENPCLYFIFFWRSWQNSSWIQDKTMNYRIADFFFLSSYK